MKRSARLVTIALALPLLHLAACDPDPGEDAGRGDAGRDTGPVEDPLRDDCEALVPEHCALPLPSDYWTVDDPTTPSGRRLAIGGTTLPRATTRLNMEHIDPAPINERDGWSVNGNILTYLPEATVTGLPRPNSIERSLESDSPTVLLDAASGERVAHFSEIDATTVESDSHRAFMIRPVVPLEHETRYIVAIRGVVDGAGNPIAPSETFAALRDNTPSEVPSIEPRRAHFEEIFTTLEANGVARADLQLAWDFTTASLADDTQWMLSVRDQALATVGPEGPDFTIDDIQELTEEENANIARRVFGTMTVPSFMTSPDPGALLNRGPDGMPMQNGTADYPFVVNIPRSASPTNKVRPIQYGHGLLGAFTQANAGWLGEFGNANGFAPFGVDWIGMAEGDVGPITVALVNGRVQDFQTVPERLCQGVVNALLAMRMMLGAFGDHPMMQVGGESIIDTSAGFYTGDSQGGIFGAVYMSLSTDVTRGILGVPGQPYNLLLNRSVDFDPYLLLLRMAFEDGIPIQLAQTLMQQLWDRAEPGSYSRHIREDLFPGTPAHEVILQPAIGDHQVTTLGAHVMARAIGAVLIEPAFRNVYGLPTMPPPYTGSAIVEFDFGLPEPLENVPNREGDDPHGDVRRNPRALAQSLHFFETGEVIHTCDGPCDPE